MRSLTSRPERVGPVPHTSGTKNNARPGGAHQNRCIELSRGSLGTEPALILALTSLAHSACRGLLRGAGGGKRHAGHHRPSFAAVSARRLGQRSPAEIPHPRGTG